MKVSVSITNHNQNVLVNKAIESLLNQSIKPETIFVCSDDTPYYTTYKNVICINHNNKGRCNNRNEVIVPFLNSDSDAIIFIDGDCFVEDYQFIKKYQKLLKKYDLIFGTRKHTDIIGLNKPASDLLTANMDELWLGKPLNYTDLRIVSGAIDGWQNAKTFYEQLDLMITGMISWSCNFAFTKSSLMKQLKFMKTYYGTAELFDTHAFNGTWGYEDVAMGIDALFCGLNIWICNNVEITHKSHNRTDNLFDHVKGRHIIMDRMRNLEAKIKIYKFPILQFMKKQLIKLIMH